MVLGPFAETKEARRAGTKSGILENFSLKKMIVCISLQLPIPSSCFA